MVKSFVTLVHGGKLKYCSNLQWYCSNLHGPAVMYMVLQ